MPRKMKPEVTGEIPPTDEAMLRNEPANLKGVSPERVPRQPQICAAAVGGIALLALIGWLTNARVLAGQWGTNIPMAPSTALAFLLLGGVLFCVARWPSQRLSRGFALAAVSLVSVASLLVIVQFLAGVDWGLERALSSTDELVGQTPVGRMSLLTAQVFLLQGLAFLVLLLSRRWYLAPAVAAACATIATAMAFTVLVGYAYGAPLLYGSPAIPMALPTGIAFLLAGFGQLRLMLPGIPGLRAWSGGSTRGMLLRAFLPSLLFLMLVEGWVDVRFEEDWGLNPALDHSLKALAACVLIVVIIGWIARRTGKFIEQAQEEIRSLARFPDESPQPVLRFTREGRLLYANQSSQPLLAHWHCEHPGEFLPERERRGIDEALQAGVSRREEVTCGDTIYSLILAPIVEMDYVSIYGRDITARKRAEDALKASEEEERRFAEQLTALIEVGNLLSSIGSLKELCRRAIELGREKLGFDRLGLWFTSDKPDAVTGTFGVDEQGGLRDEWGAPVTAGPGSVMWKVLHERSAWLREEDTPLYNHHAQAIGRGTLAVAGLWDGERMIGCLSTDNLVRGEPLTDRQCQLLSLYGSELGHLLTRQRAEEALRESETRFSTLFHSSPARASLTRFEDGVFLDVNEGFLQATGRGRDEVVGNTSLGLDDWVYPEERDKLRSVLTERGSVRSFEAKLRAKSGDIRDVLMSADVIDLSGQPCILSVALDITDRRRAEQSLRESEEWFRTLADTTSTGILIYQGERFVYVNRACAMLSGRTAEEFLDLRFWDLIHPDFRELVRDRGLARQRGESVPDGYEVKILRRDGEERWIDFTAGKIDWKGQPAVLGTAFDITERKRAEEAVRESERNMRELMRHTRCGLWSGKIVAIPGGEDSSRMRDAFLWQIHPQPDEQALQDMVPLDASPDGFYSTAIYLSVPEEGRAAKDAVGLAALRRGDDHYSQEFRCYDRDGRMHWIHEEMSLQPRTPGCWKVFGVWVDVTERKRAEEAVRESEQRLASIYNTVGDVIFHLAVEPEGQFRFVSVNPAFLRVTGLRQEMVVGRTVNEIIPEPSLTMVLDKYRQAMEENTIVHWEETSDYPNGRLTGEVSIAPVVNAKGVCTHLVGSVHDITGRKRAEEAVRESEARYRMLVQTMNEGLIAVDNNDVIQFVNERMTQMVGYSREELMGKAAHNVLIHEDDRDLLLEKNRLRLRQVSDDYEVRMKTKSGEIIWIRISGAPVLDAQGKVVGSIGVQTDITARKLAEEALRKSAEEKEVLLREIHHRVKNNLQVISSLLRLQSRKLTDPVARAALAEHEHRIYSMSLIHESLYREEDMGSVDMASYLKNLSAHLQRAFREIPEGITIPMHIEAPTLPIDLATPCGQIVTELVTNSFKHAFPRDRVSEGEISLSLRREPGDLLRLEVCDNGVGLPPDFDARRTESLGVHLVTLLAEQQLRGTVHWSSDKGTRVDIVFPET